MCDFIDLHVVQLQVYWHLSATRRVVDSEADNLCVDGVRTAMPKEHRGA